MNPKSDWNFEQGLMLMQILHHSVKLLNPAIIPKPGLAIEQHYNEENHYNDSLQHEQKIHWHMARVQMILEKEGIPSKIYSIWNQNEKIGAAIDCAGAWWTPLGINSIPELLTFHGLDPQQDITFVELTQDDHKFSEDRKHEACMEMMQHDFQTQEINWEHVIVLEVEPEDPQTKIKPKKIQAIIEDASLSQTPNFHTGNETSKKDELKMKAQTILGIESLTKDQMQNHLDKIKPMMQEVSTAIQQQTHPYFNAIEQAHQDCVKVFNNPHHIEKNGPELVFLISKGQTRQRGFKKIPVNLETQQNQQETLQALNFSLMANMPFHMGIKINGELHNVSYIGDVFFEAGAFFSPTYNKQFKNTALDRLAFEEVLTNTTITWTNDGVNEENISLAEHPQIKYIQQKEIEVNLQRAVEKKLEPASTTNKRF